MADQVYIVIEVAYEVIRDVMCCSASVPDELPLGHFVFDVGAGQVDGQQDQTVAQHIHRICRETRLNREQTGLLSFLTSFHTKLSCVALKRTGNWC